MNLGVWIDEIEQEMKYLERIEGFRDREYEVMSLDRSIRDFKTLD